MDGVKLWNDIRNKHRPFLITLYEKQFSEQATTCHAQYLQILQTRFPQVFDIRHQPFTVYFHTEDGDLAVSVTKEGTQLHLIAKFTHSPT